MLRPLYGYLMVVMMTAVMVIMMVVVTVVMVMIMLVGMSCLHLCQSWIYR